MADPVHIARGVGRLTQYTFTEGKGSYLFTKEGKKFLDFTSGIGVTNLGHCHPAVTKRAQEQCGKITHLQVNIGYHEPYLQLIEKLIPKMPHKSLDTFFFWNSGSEAVEAAVKLARHATGRQNIVVMQGSYHGRTMGTMAMTRSKTIYGEGYGPLMPGVFATPFPYDTQCKLPEGTNLTDFCIDQFEMLLQQQTAPRDTAAVIIEPVLGEGGYVAPPADFLPRMQKICNSHGILLILDEVQSGFGRTGKYFATSYFDVIPDIMVMAKGIANGFPLSGIVSRKELMDKQAPGSMGGTYAGNAVACAAGIACAEVMDDEKILENVQARSNEMFSMLKRLQQEAATSKYIKDVRGLGLMIGLEFKASAKIAGQVQAKCMEKGLLILTTSIFDTLRFIPPLTISQTEMAEGCAIIKQSIEEVCKAL